MAFPKSLGELCLPAQIYLAISVIGIIIALFQNIGNPSDKYNLGTICCRVPNSALMFILKIILILFWTWILNLMCKDGHAEIAWFLVLLPFILLFSIMALYSYNK